MLDACSSGEFREGLHSEDKTAPAEYLSVAEG